MEPPIEEVLELGKEYIPLIFEGETILTIARGILFLKNGASLVVNCSPFGCMPGNVSASIFQKISAEQGKPIISLFYDGESDMNRIVRIYLSNIKES
jgi:predicted nucleotide-binding protein (sugar kinase/HSP70/actin superfamily)